jgi:C4-dicarboxylate-specific signal transduction histidine kinase
VVPFGGVKAPVGALSAAVTHDRRLSDKEVRQLRLVVDILANVRARRQAEVDAQRSRQELAHIARRASMGELAASLAHQLNQPLTGILSNAQAAQSVLASGGFVRAEIAETLSDIVDDCRRARDVIQRVREMVAPSDAQVVRLNLSALVYDVAMLLASEAMIRRVSMSLDFEDAALTVEGDRILLRQAILNVIMNAIDAVADLPLGERVVSVQTTTNGHGEVQVRVRDHGTGLPAGVETRVFEPFFSTKTTGIGMGLAISRSIVENHGGSIRIENAPTRGVLVSITLPALVELKA